MTNQEEKRQKVKKKRVWTAAIILLIVAILSFIGFRFGQAVFTNEAMDDLASAKTYDLVVHEGESVYQIGEDLASQDIIGSALIFLIQSKLYGCNVLPGEYKVNSAMSSKEILKLLEEQYKLKQTELKNDNR